MGTETTFVYTAVYSDKAGALADLNALEQLHDRDLLWKYDAAVIDKEGGKPAHRQARRQAGLPGRSRTLRRRHAAAEGAARSGDRVDGPRGRADRGGEPTLEKAFDEAITRAAKTAKRSFDAIAWLLLGER